MDSNSTIEKRNNNGMMASDESLQDSFFNILIRHRWTILITTLISLTVTFLYILKATPYYTSNSRIYVEQSGPRIMSEYEGLMTQSNNYLYTQGELIKSTPIVAGVADDSKIRRFRTFENIDNLALFLKKNLDVSIGRKDDIITVSFDSPYPVEAAEIVNSVIRSYIQYHSVRKRSTVAEVLKILQKEKIKRDEELSDKYDQLLNFTREHGVVSFDNNGGNVVFERLNKLSMALTEAQLNELNTKADYEATKSMRDEPSKIKQFASASSASGVRVSINDRETQLQAELREAEIELKNARYHCTEDHPAVQAIHAKITRIKSELDDQAEEFAESYIEVMRLRWMTADQRKQELQESFDQQLAAARDLGLRATEYAVLQSELERTERLCDILDDRIKELNVTEDVGALNISILEVARPADDPSKPEKGKYMAISLVLGLMLGSGLAVLRDMMDYRLRSAEEISVILGLPVLGVIPSMYDGKSITIRKKRVWPLLKLVTTGNYQREENVPGKQTDKKISPIENSHRKNSQYEFGSVKWIRNAKRKNGLIGDNDPYKEDKNRQKDMDFASKHIGKARITLDKNDCVNRGQKTQLEPKSIVAEAYRTVRTAIFFGVPKERAKSILVTSPAPGDGKSTVASNIAITMAQAGQRTLLLDADFRKPMQHNIFEIDYRKPGLTNIISGQICLEEALHHGPVEGLDIVHCGVEVPNPSELLNSETFADMLKAFMGKYDRVIIDSPPVGPVADSQILSAICDITLLVLRAEVSTRRHSQQAIESLQNVGGYVLGAVVNDVRRRRGRYGYYSNYGYYGQYGYYGRREKQATAV